MTGAHQLRSGHDAPYPASLSTCSGREALEVKASYARFVARRTRDLTVDQDARRVKAIAVLANPHHAVALIDAFIQWRDRPECPVEDDDARVRTGARPELDWPSMPTVTLHVHTYAGREGR